MLKLRGHYNPFHEYPSAVVPICQDDQGNLLALYDGSTAVPLHENFRFEPSPNDDQEFDPELNVLFAHSPNDIVSFLRKEAPEVYQDILRNPAVRVGNPFNLISYAEISRNGGIVDTALRQCVLELGGPQDPFAADWYLTETPRLRDDLAIKLPRSVQELFAETLVLTVSCEAIDEQAMRGAARAFNQCAFQERGSSILLQLTADAGDFAIGTRVHGQITQSQSLDAPAAEGPPLCAGEVVLAVSPQLEELHREPPQGWHDFWQRALDSPGFEWIRPRPGTPDGDLVDVALTQLFAAPDAARGAKPTTLDRINNALGRYAPSEDVALELAFQEQRWRVGALVAQRHRLAQSLRNVPRDSWPLILKYERGPLPVSFSVNLRTSSGQELQAAADAFAAFNSSSSGQEMLHTTGLLSPQPPVEPEVLAAARSLTQSMELPIAAYLVADVSGSMTEKLTAAKMGMVAFLAQLNAERGDMAGLITFSDKVRVPVGLDHLKEVGAQLESAIEGLTPGGQTALLDAVEIALNELHPMQRCIKTIVVLTDGQENSSSLSFPEAEVLVRNWRTPRGALYALAYGRDADVATLQRLSQLAGGTTYSGNLQNIRHLFLRISSLL